MRKLNKPIGYDWSRVKGVAAGIPVVVSGPSPYINLDVPEVAEAFKGIQESYWRDVPFREPIREAYEQFVEPRPTSIDPVCSDKAWSRVRAYLKDVRGLRVKTIASAFQGMPQSTSPGLPFVRTGHKTKRDAAVGIKNQVRTWWRKADALHASEISEYRRVVKKELRVYPCVAGARRVIRLYPKNRPRLVWVYPGSNICLEAQYAQPLMEALSDAPWIGWSVNWLDGGKSRTRMFPPANCKAIASIDFSSFDSSVLARFIRKAFELIKECFELSEVEDVMFEFLVEYFVNTPLLLFDRVVQKHRGVPSGSYFTQLIDTLVNMFYCFYVDETQSPIDGSRLLASGHVWLGDDSRLLFGEWYGAYDFPRRWIARFGDLGAVVSVDKFDLCVVSEDTEAFGSFLSRTILPGFPHLAFDFNKFRAQLLIPEDEDKSVSVFVSRLIGLCWAYGFDRRSYDLLSMLCPRDIVPERSVRFERWLEYVLGVKEVDLSSFPDYDRVKLRYFGYL